MRRNRPVVEAILVALVVCAPHASPAVEPPRSGIAVASMNGRNRLSTPSLGVFHDTSNRVDNTRVIEAPWSNSLLLLWDEWVSGGKPVAHYAVSLDGESVSGRVRATSYTINLRYAHFDPLETVPGVNPALTADRSSEIFLVQFWAVPLDEFRVRIESLGGRVLRFMSNHTYIARLPERARTQVEAMPQVRWVGPFHPAYKLDESILSALVVDAPGQIASRYSIEAFERGGEPQRTIARAIAALGGRVHMTNPGGFRMEATLTNAQLLHVARMDKVHFIDRWGPGEADMDIVREFVGANHIAATLGISGQGVRGEIFDTGLDTTHPEWQFPPIIHSQTAGTSTSHGTSVYGICYARGLSAGHKGLLPDGQGIFFTMFENSQFGGAKPLHDILAELLDPIDRYRAVFFTSSVGSPRTLRYTTISAETDDAVFRNQIVVMWTNGNSGNPQSRPQSWAKNIISVGGVYHRNTLDPLDDNWGAGASTGPAEDGRIQPHFILFYDLVQTTMTGGGYRQFGGSSASTPGVAGSMGLLMQMWHKGVWTGHGGMAGVFESRPKPMTARALLANNAFRYNWTAGGPNGDIRRDVQGWGVPDLAAAERLSDATRIIDETDTLLPFQTRTYTYEVPPDTPELNVTMSYIDTMGTTSSTQHRINDLSLRVISPSGVSYWGNNGLRDSNWSSAGGESNTLDTMESVFVSLPEPGVWEVRVIADELVQDTHVETPQLDADFALVVTGVLEQTCYADCNNDGSLDIFDFLCFQNSFVAGEPYACDCDPDPACDIFDFLCFQNAFVGGCP